LRLRGRIVSAWQTAAACAGTGPDGFYGSDDEVERARQLCAGCPVAEPCLWAAMVDEADASRYGVWGGTVPATRRAIANALGGSRFEFGRRLAAALATWERSAERGAA